MTEGRDPANGHFLPGNSLWRTRSSAGPKPKFEAPEDLAAACQEYFDWVEQNPLYEARPMKGEGGSIEMVQVPKMRIMTVGGMCIFLDIARSTWDHWKANRSDLSAVISWAEEIITAQKLEGAAADMLNANIISRLLGLADKKETDHTMKRIERVEHVILPAVDHKMKDVTPEAEE